MAGWIEKDDHELLALIQDGSHHAFATLVERHSERFFRLAYRYAGTRAMAEDAVQDAFLRLWERPHLWQPDKGTKFTTWFYRVVVNICLDARKKKQPLPLIDDAPLPDERPGTDAQLIASQERQAVEREIAALPERQRTALSLCYDAELSHQDAADAMGVTLKALQSLLMRAKTTLKDKLGHMEGNRHVA